MPSYFYRICNSTSLSSSNVGLWSLQSIGDPFPSRIHVHGHREVILSPLAATHAHHLAVLLQLGDELVALLDDVGIPGTGVSL